MTPNQATFSGPFLLLSHKFRHETYRTLTRNHYPPHQSLRSHRNRAFHPALKMISATTAATNPSDSTHVTRQFVAAIAAPDTAAGLFRSLPLGPHIIQTPGAGMPHSLPLGPHFAQGLTTDLLGCVFVGPRYDQDPATAPPYGVLAGHRFSSRPRSCRSIV